MRSIEIRRKGESEFRNSVRTRPCETCLENHRNSVYGVQTGAAGRGKRTRTTPAKRVLRAAWKRGVWIPAGTNGSLLGSAGSVAVPGGGCRPVGRGLRLFGALPPLCFPRGAPPTFGGLRYVHVQMTRCSQLLCSLPCFFRCLSLFSLPAFEEKLPSERTLR